MFVSSTPDQTKVCVRSEGGSPSTTRPPSVPSLNEEQPPSGGQYSPPAPRFRLNDGSEPESRESKDQATTTGDGENSGREKSKNLRTLLTMNSGSSSVGGEDGDGVSGAGVSGAGGEDGDSVNGCEEAMSFCVGEVRKRLSIHSSARKRTFTRDPQDPSGEGPSALWSDLLSTWIRCPCEMSSYIFMLDDHNNNVIHTCT